MFYRHEVPLAQPFGPLLMYLNWRMGIRTVRTFFTMHTMALQNLHGFFCTWLGTAVGDWKWVIWSCKSIHSFKKNMILTYSALFTMLHARIMEIQDCRLLGMADTP